MGVLRTLAIFLLLATSAVGASERTLRLHGSNTIGATLVPALAREFLLREGMGTIEQRPLAENEVLFRGRDGDGNVLAIEIHSHGSSTGFRDLAEGSCDIGMASRPAKDAEVQNLRAIGDLRSPECEHVLALDGIAVIVHPDNPIDALPINLLADIFAGRIRTWSRVGGTTAPINVYARDDKSGTFETFEKLLMGGRSLTGSAERFESNAELSLAVSNDPNGIGFTGVSYILEAKALRVADGDAEPMYPTTFSVAAEDYPLARRLYLYTPAEPDNPLVRDFVEFALSEDGQEIVAQEGFVDQLVQIADEQIVAPYQSFDENLFGGAKRLSTTLRFREGSYVLDNRAVRDVRRLADYFLADLSGATKVQLVGYSDSVGREDANLRLSEFRAIAAEVELIAEGVLPAVVLGLGQEMPVASNETPIGRGRNRRVEVWISSNK